MFNLISRYFIEKASEFFGLQLNVISTMIFGLRTLCIGKVCEQYGESSCWTLRK